LQPDSAAAFYTVRRPLVQTATGQDDDAALPDVGKNHDLCEHSSGDHDKTLDAAASCKEPEFQLGVGRIAPEASRAIGLGRVCAAHVVKRSSPGSSKLSFDDPTSPRKRGEVYLYHGSMPNSVPVRCPSPDALRASTSPRTRVEVSYFLRNARADAHELGYKAL
jgi:hypothetical protein